MRRVVGNSTGAFDEIGAELAYWQVDKWTVLKRIAVRRGGYFA